MHEHSLMQNLFQKIENIASHSGAKRVTKVHVKIGALAHISASHFREHFDEIRPTSVAKDAELMISMDDNIHDAQAQDITLLSVDIEE